MTKPVRSPLTERDEQVLLSLFKYRYLTIPQLRRLHFRSLQTAGRRLRRLRTAGFVTAFPVQGVGGYVEVLTEKGTEAVAARLDVALEDLQWSPPTHDARLDTRIRHALSISDFRIALTSACDASETVHLLGFAPAHVQDRATAPGWQALVHEVVTDCYDPTATLDHDPDAVFALEVGGTVQLYFLEIDRKQVLEGVGRRSLRHLIDFYESLRASDGAGRYRELFRLNVLPRSFHVLVVVAGETRLQALLSAIAKQPASRRLGDLFWVALRNDLSPVNLLTVHWTRLSSPGRCHTTLSGEVTPKVLDRRDDGKPPASKSA